ncbi:hypothetical protein [Mucilaginibacter sp.]|uniref:hypothetical protein n=1 Tax=Mucilaginibacter sp. TaxID=1882438 RepID=UPI003D1188FA
MAREKTLVEVAAEETGSLLKTGVEEVAGFGVAVLEEIGAFFYSPSNKEEPEPNNHCGCNHKK